MTRRGRAVHPSFAKAGFKRAAPGRYVHASGKVEIEFLPREVDGKEVLEAGWQAHRFEQGGDVIDHDGLYPRLTDALVDPTVLKWIESEYPT